MANRELGWLTVGQDWGLVGEWKADLLILLPGPILLIAGWRTGNHGEPRWLVVGWDWGLASGQKANLSVPFPSLQAPIDLQMANGEPG